MKGPLRSLKEHFFESKFPNERLEIFFETQWKPILGAFLLSTAYCLYSINKTQDWNWFLGFWIIYNGISALRLAFSILFKKKRELFTSQVWNIIFNVGMFTHGVLWATIGYYNSSSTHDDLVNFTTALLISVSASNIISYPSNRLSHYVYVPLVLLPYCFGIIHSNNQDHQIVAWLIALIFVPIAILASLNNFKLVINLLKASQEKGRMELELKTAQTVQKIFLPPSIQQLPGLQVAGYYETAFECGGDWWHTSVHQDKVYIWIADVTGHGVGPALMTSAARGIATSLERQGLDPATCASTLNSCLWDLFAGEYSMSLFLACIDSGKNELRYVNCSHPAPLHIPKMARVKDDLVPLHEKISPLIGESPTSIFEECSHQFTEGDSLVFFTDGVLELVNPAGEAWGERNFLKSLLKSSQSSTLTADGMIQDIHSWFGGFRKQEVLQDDVTLVVCKKAA